MPSDDAVLLDIREAAGRIIEFGGGLTAADFETDAKTLSSVLYQITVLGEAVKQLSAEFRQAHAGIAWKEAAGTRDRVIHDYRRVDLQIVADVVNVSVPRLLEQIEAINE